MELRQIAENHINQNESNQMERGAAGKQNHGKQTKY